MKIKEMLDKLELVLNKMTVRELIASQDTLLKIRNKIDDYIAMLSKKRKSMIL